MKEYIFTSESVTEGHPDKMADQISDAILDYIIERDPDCRVACEVLLSNGFCVIAGELKTKVYAPMQEIARNVIREIGYTDAQYGFDYRTAGVLNAIAEQSGDIQRGVEKEDGNIGAGDSGLMFGYACNETPTLMPMPIYLAHKLTKRLAEVRKSGLLPYLRPDGKAQVSVVYKDGIPVAIDNILIVTQHAPEVEYEQLVDDIKFEVIEEVIQEALLTAETKYQINPTGKFVIGGPQGDAGVTGRKIEVDTYGGAALHGGGAFSGKDPTKMDRSGAYMARYIAKNMVAAKVCEKITIQLSYAIGNVKPVSIFVDTYNSACVGDEEIIQCIKNLFDLSPKGIIKHLELTKPFYKAAGVYGHFGKEENIFLWERTDRVEQIRAFFKL